MRWVCLLLLAACRYEAPVVVAPAASPTPKVNTAPAPKGNAAAPGEAPKEAAPALPAHTALPAAERVVVIGDLHGDWDNTKKVLLAAKLVDAPGKWIGGAAVLVQVGDQLDRGDQEQVILDNLDALGVQAKAAGGAVHVLLGNHEIMNAAGDFRYVTEGGWDDFEDVPAPASPALAGVPPDHQGRVAAFSPGGPYAALLARHQVVLQIGDTVFVHGGLRPEHVRYGVDRINAETSAWLRGEGAKPPILDGETAPVWSRHYSGPDPDCATLSETLSMLGAARMVVGHTVQEQGANAACDGKVWRADVGLSKHYGGAPAGVEITPAGVRVVQP